MQKYDFLFKLQATNQYKQVMRQMKYSVLLLLSIAILGACSQRQNKKDEITQTPNNQVEFFKHFKKLEGRRYAGKEIFIAEGKDSWAALELEIYVREYTDTIIYIPFRVGDNKSRPWMIIMEKGNKLRFRHDHRHEDGTPEDLNLYGGYATEEGTSIKQFFPADEFTCKMLDRIRDNEWIVEFSEDLTKFYYSLRKKGELIITVEFDLSTPVE